jgi:hypothetical protein
MQLIVRYLTPTKSQTILSAQNKRKILRKTASDLISMAEPRLNYSLPTSEGFTVTENVRWKPMQNYLQQKGTLQLESEN